MALPETSEIASTRARWSLDRLFGAAMKDTVIRLRWPLVILSSYLLYYTPSGWLTPAQVQAILILYLLSHSTLYFLADEFFDSPYFYGPLLVFDTLVLVAVLSSTGAASPDFYLACLLTLILSCVCRDTRGLLAVTFLAPLAYGYFVFYTATDFDSELFLRLPFPFVISLFYGYFAQVERIRRAARDKEQQAEREQKAAEEIRRRRERLEVLYQTNLAMTSTLDPAKRLTAFLETVLIHLPYAAAFVRRIDPATAELATAVALGLKSRRPEGGDDPLAFADRLLDGRRRFVAGSVSMEGGDGGSEFLRSEGLRSFVGLPLIANEMALGSLVLLSREERLSDDEEEIEFLSTLAGQVAIGIQHAELYVDSRRRSKELLNEQKVKDEFLKSISTQLKTPLGVIAGYAEMFLDGSVGEMTPLQEKAMETVARQSKAACALINTLFHVSEIDSEPLQAELHEVHLWELLADLRASYDEPLAKDVKIVWNYPSDLPCVRVDQRKLKQILGCLVENAIKFTDAGAVTISADYSMTEKALRFEIADTGVGIPQEEIPTIFEKCRQRRDPDSSSRGGAGLGLYIAKKYTDILGGVIHVASRAGHGSVFTVQVPAPIKPTYFASQTSGDAMTPGI